MTNTTSPSTAFGVQPPFAGVDFKGAGFRALVRAKKIQALVLETLAGWQRRSETRHRMRQLDDHMLADVGLSRADLEREVRKPFWSA